jgi:thiol:disulfide interchange protein DsbD
MLNTIIIAALALSTANPPDAPVKWTFNTEELPNGQVRVNITANIDKGWHVYATQLPSDEGPLPTVIALADDKRFYTVDGVKEPEPEKAHDPNFGMMLHYHSNTVVFSQVIARRGAQAFTVNGEVEYMACNDEKCLPPVKVPFAVEVPALSQ